MVYKVSLTGIDGGGKSTSLSNVAENLSLENKVAVLCRDSYVSGKGIIGKKEILKNIMVKIDAAHCFADRFKVKSGVGLVNLFYALTLSRMEDKIISEFNPNLLLCGRDRLVDSAVYSSFYFPFTKYWSLESKLKIADAINRGKHSDLLVYLDIEPSIALKRIEAREKGNNNPERQMHENLRDLTLLRGSYLSILDFLKNNKKINVAKIDVKTRSQEDITNEIVSIIREKMNTN